MHKKLQRMFNSEFVEGRGLEGMKKKKLSWLNFLLCGIQSLDQPCKASVTTVPAPEEEADSADACGMRDCVHGGGT